jgi:hypothetical protein
MMFRWSPYFNASEDTVDVLTMFFEQKGFRAVGRTWPARESITPDAALGFMAKHLPQVIILRREPTVRVELAALSRVSGIGRGMPDPDRADDDQQTCLN